MKKIKNVLFLCLGNSSRNSLAHGLALWLKNTKYKKELNHINSDSAGFVNVFKTAQTETIDYLKTKDIDFSDFHGKLMDQSLLEKQDLILVMEKFHLKRLRRKSKSVKNIAQKSFFLLEFAGETNDLDIQDPVNFDKEVYQKVIAAVERGVIKSLEKIIQINKE